MLNESRKTISLDEVFVKAKYRGKRIGRKIVRFVQAYAKKKKKAIVLMADSFDKRRSSAQLAMWYQKQGFKIVKQYNDGVTSMKWEK